MRNDATPAGRPGLLRVLGRWDLTAIGVNQTIGGAIFAVPAALAAGSGAWSPWLVVAIGCASLLIALSFAEVASRFEGTGGPYLYARAAFGRFVAFEVGWLTWVTRLASWASILNVLVLSLGFYWPSITAGLPRVSVLTGVLAAVTVINVLGIRQSSLAVNTFTAAKLIPLLVFGGAGVWFVDPSRLVPSHGLAIDDLAASALLLVFAFGGYENILIPAGEARDPRRGVPFALMATIAVVTLVFTATQVVALGVLPTVATSRTPLADAASLFLGPAGAALMTTGAVVSIAGANLGGILAGSRTLFALAEQGYVPAWFGRVHAHFRTPVMAITVTSTVTAILAISGTFVVLAQVSAISRLLIYAAASGAAIRLRHPRFAGTVPPPAFVPPLPRLVPWLALAVALTILFGATRENLVAGLAAVAAGAAVYGITPKHDGWVPRSENVA